MHAVISGSARQEVMSYHDLVGMGRVTVLMEGLKRGAAHLSSSMSLGVALPPRAGCCSCRRLGGFRPPPGPPRLCELALPSETLPLEPWPLAMGAPLLTGVAAACWSWEAPSRGVALWGLGLFAFTSVQRVVVLPLLPRLLLLAGDASCVAVFASISP